MKTLSLITCCILLFLFSYQIRSSFISLSDFNPLSDANEYVKASQNLLPWIAEVRQEIYIHNKQAIGAFNTHGTPLYVTMLLVSHMLHVHPQTVCIILSSLLPVILSIVVSKVFPLPYAIMTGLATAVYTPFFSFLPTTMPESITPVAIPLLLLAVTYLSLKGTSIVHYVLAGLGLLAIGLLRHVFLYYGILFFILWLFVSDVKRKKRMMLPFILSYVIPLGIWITLVSWSGFQPYSRGAFFGSIYQSHNVAIDGWSMDPSIGHNFTWSTVLEKIFLRQPLPSLFLITLERIPRFLRSPANTYASSFPLTQPTLEYLHLLVLFLAAWGLRFAFKNRFLLLSTSLVIWNTLFVSSFYLEETRLQLPATAILFLLAAAGAYELSLLIKNRKTRLVAITIPLLFLFWSTMRSHILDVEYSLIHPFSDARILYWFHIISTAALFIWCTTILLQADKKTQLVLPGIWIRRIYSFIPIMLFGIVLIPQARSYVWHEWSAPLRAGQMIQQTIDIPTSHLTRLTQQNGYILIDMKDPNAALHIKVTLNEKEITARVPIKTFLSSEDMNAIRQWQRHLPRLGGYMQTETELAHAPVWPDLRQWLVLPVNGKLVQQSNTITLTNTSLLSSTMPVIYGDYPPFGTDQLYEGPDPRLFAGRVTHNKYQVGGDMRLTTRLPLLSQRNTSKFFVSSTHELTDDLSVTIGNQWGRYRIFFLFPYTKNDPEDIY